MDALDRELEEEVQPSFPTYTVLLFLLLAVFLGSLIGSAAVFGLSAARGIDFQEVLTTMDRNSPLRIRNFVRTINLISHFFTFTAPALAVAYVFYRQRWSVALGLDRAPRAINIGLAAVFIAAAFPLAQTTYWLNQQLPIPEWARQMERSATGMLEGLLVMESPAELLYNLLVVAVLPALGEELLFRGLLQQQLERGSRRPHLAIWLAALLFSAIHLQFEGFLPRLLLGAGLGYLFYWTRNLWIPIIAHFLFNGGQVVARYFYGEDASALDLEEVQDPQWAAFALGLAVAFGSGYYLWQYNRAGRNRLTSDRTAL